MKTVFFIVGRTASGKDSLTNAVAQDLNMKVLKSYATRPMRKDDPKDVESHIFIKPKEVKQYKSKILAYTKIGKFEYFSTIDQLKESDFYIIDPNGIDFIKKQNIDGIRMCIIYIYVPEKIRQARALYRRKDDIETFKERNSKEQKQFDLFEKEKCWDYIITNINLKKTICQLKTIVQREREINESKN